MAAFQRKQEANGDQFARIEVRLRMLGHSTHLVIDRTKYQDDQFFGGSQAAPFSCFRTESVRFFHDHLN